MSVLTRIIQTVINFLLMIHRSVRRNIYESPVVHAPHFEAS